MNTPTPQSSSPVEAPHLDEVSPLQEGRDGGSGLLRSVRLPEDRPPVHVHQDLEGRALSAYRMI